MSGAIVGASLAAAGAIGGGLISANAAGNAASDQAGAANNAANLQYQASQNALGFQQQQWSQDQANIAPWLQSGASGLGNLDYLLGITPPTTQGTMTGGSPTPSANGLSGGLQPNGAPASPISPGAGTPTSGIPMPNGNPAQPNAPAARNLSTTPQPMGQPSGAPASATGNINAPGAGTLTPNGPGAPQPMAGQAGGSPTTGVNFNTQTMGGAPATSGQPSAILSQPFSAGNGSTGSVPVPNVPGSSTPSGSTNLGSTVNPSLGGFGSLMQGYGQTFQAPTAEQGMNSPGTQAQLQLGTQALQQSAAARGSLLTGGTAQALDQYGQQLGAQGYQNAYNNSYNTFASNYNQYQQQQANEYNRLASLAGIGQTSAQQLGSLGSAASSNVTSNLLGTAGQIGQDYQNAGAANASGVVGSANAYSGALGGASSSLQNMLLLSQLQGAGGYQGLGQSTAAAGQSAAGAFG